MPKDGYNASRAAYYLTDLKGVALYRRALSKYAPSARPNFV